MQDYLLLELSIKSIANSDDRFISKLSNLSAVIYQYMDRLNWAGFYILDETWNNLYLGPFQGKIACSNIKISEGVCGKAVRDNAVQRVADVHSFDGHIACDSDSESEIVLPLKKYGKIWGVLDIDSPEKNRFSQEDEEFLTRMAQIIGENVFEEKKFYEGLFTNQWL